MVSLNCVFKDPGREGMLATPFDFGVPVEDEVLEGGECGEKSGLFHLVHPRWEQVRVSCVFSPVILHMRL